MQRNDPITIIRTEYHHEATGLTYYIDRDPITGNCTAWFVHVHKQPSLWFLGASKQEEKARGIIEANAELHYRDRLALRPKE